MINVNSLLFKKVQNSYFVFICICYVLICRSNIIKASPSISLSVKKQAYLDSIKVNEEKVTNAYNSIPSPNKISLSKKNSKESTAHLSLTSDLIPRTDSFITKQRSVQKLISGRGPEIVASKQFVKHCQVLTELQTLHSNIVKPVEKLNQRSKEISKKKKIEGSNVFKKISTIWPQLDPEPDPSPFRLDSMDKKKPIPLPKPKANIENDLSKINKLKLNNFQPNVSPGFGRPLHNFEMHESDELIYANTNALNDEQIYQNTSDFIESEQIYVNVAQLNISDDAKAKIEPDSIYIHMMSTKNNINTYTRDSMYTEKPAYTICDDATTVDQNYDTYTVITPQGEKDNDHYMSMTLTENQDNDIYTHMSPNNPDNDNIETFVEDPENIYLPIRKDEIYMPMRGKPYRRMSFGDTLYMARKYSVSSDYVNLKSDVKNRCKGSSYNYTRVKSIPEGFHFGLNCKPYSMHIRGVSGCLFEEIDYKYVYELNPTAIQNNEYPFTKKRQKESDMPCYCKDLSNYKDYDVVKSQNLYYSCEKVCPEKEDSEYTYVGDLKNPSKFYKVKGAVGNNMVLKRINNTESALDDTSTEHPDSSDKKPTGMIKKKINQIKQLVTDW